MEQREQYTILTCPHCGDTKKVFNFICAHPFTKELWSDLYEITPYMPTIFPVQKCCRCGKYYFIKKEQHHIVDIDAFVDTLDYRELKEAAEEFSGSELSTWERLVFSFSLLQAYNSEFMRQDNAKTPSDEDRALFTTAAENIMKYYEGEGSALLKGELLRELGRFDEAVEVLRNLPDDDHLLYYVKPVLEHALNRDPLPLLLIKDDKFLYQ